MSTRRRRAAGDEPTASLASVEDADAPSVARRGAPRRGKTAADAMPFHPESASAPATPAAAARAAAAGAAARIHRAASALAAAPRAEAALPIALLLIFAVFCTWHYQLPAGIGKLKPAEVNKFMATIEKLPFPDAPALAARLRHWADADDGRPVFMVNLMRQHSTPVHLLRKLGGELLGIPPTFNGTAEEANAKYEAAAIPLLLAHGAYPVVLGNAQTPKPIMSGRPERDWSRAGLVRYPNRRAFLRLITNPSYTKVAPLKFGAMEVDLLPISAQMLGFVGCDLTWIVGLALLSVFLGAGWARAVRHSA